MDIEIAMHNLGDPVYLEVVKESTILSNRQTLVVAKIKKTKKTHWWLQKAKIKKQTHTRMVAKSIFEGETDLSTTTQN